MNGNGNHTVNATGTQTASNATWASKRLSTGRQNRGRQNSGRENTVNTNSNSNSNPAPPNCVSTPKLINTNNHAQPVGAAGGVAAGEFQGGGNSNSRGGMNQNNYQR
jgi:hypothetical protein